MNEHASARDKSRDKAHGNPRSKYYRLVLAAGYIHVPCGPRPRSPPTKDESATGVPPMAASDGLVWTAPLLHETGPARIPHADHLWRVCCGLYP